MNILKQRIEILQGQIDRAKESGETHNFAGVPMADEIKKWERMIKKAQKTIKKAKS